jgi:hypothetical protein
MTQPLMWILDCARQIPLGTVRNATSTPCGTVLHWKTLLQQSPHLPACIQMGLLGGRCEVQPYILTQDNSKSHSIPRAPWSGWRECWTSLMRTVSQPSTSMPSPASFPRQSSGLALLNSPYLDHSGSPCRNATETPKYVHCSISRIKTRHQIFWW